MKASAPLDLSKLGGANDQRLRKKGAERTMEQERTSPLGVASTGSLDQSAPARAVGAVGAVGSTQSDDRQIEQSDRARSGATSGSATADDPSRVGPITVLASV